MESREVIRQAIAKRGYTQKQAAEAMGYKGQPGIGQMLRRTNGGRLDKFVQLMDSLGYEVVVRDKDTKNGAEWTLDK